MHAADFTSLQSPPCTVRARAISLRMKLPRSHIKQL